MNAHPNHNDAGPNGLVWFRRDLQLRDNPAWSAATSQNDRVVALFVLNEDYPGPIVDHSLARQRTLDAYGRARGENP